MSSLHDHVGGCQYSDDSSCSSSSSSSSSDGIDFNYATKDTSKNATTGKKVHTRSNKEKKKVSKSQHSLDSLRQHVSHLMSIFEGNGWFIPMPDFNNNKRPSDQEDQNNHTKKKGGKVWSNRNYGADKKRQRKQSERVMLENRIHQLEMVLKDAHGVDNP